MGSSKHTEASTIGPGKWLILYMTVGLVVGLVIGGHDGLQRQAPVARSGNASVSGQASSEVGLHLWRVQDDGRGIDARLVPLATPTPGPDVPRATPPDTTIEAIICTYPWPQGCEYWIRLGLCESSLSPHAIGYAGRYVGVFQVWLGHGYGYDWLLDPANNTLAAWELSYGGWYTGPWPVCQYQ